MNFSNCESEAFVICPKCHGSGLDKIKSVELLHLCKKCNGSGDIDWVSATMNSRYSQPHPSKQYDVALRNIQMLQNEIVQQGVLVGVRVNVNIEIDHYPERLNYEMRSRMLLNGGY